MWKSCGMTGRRWPGGIVVRGSGAMLALWMASLPFALNSSAQSARGDTEAQYVEGGAARCLICHGGERMRMVAATVHGDTDNPFTPYSNQGCQSCHGPGSLHVSRARGGIGFPAMLAFNGEEPPQRYNAACLSCHANDMGELSGMEWRRSIHDAGGISCIDCHQGHSVDDAMTERPQQVQVCATCHSGQIANHRRFENVGIVFDDLKCYNCHDVHQMIREP